MNSLPTPGSSRLTAVQWLICVVAAIGFAFDTYVLLIMPLVARPALAELLGVPLSDPRILKWTGYIMWSSAISGGVFGLLGGYLADRLGRRRLLTWSILLYAVASVASGFATSAEMLLVFRCLTFIGVCVEFVAAVAWLAELFPEPRQREAVLGYTQAFASIGGLLVTVAFKASVSLAGVPPKVAPLLGDWAQIYGHHTAWRYALISGLIPALPLLVIRPFLPESPVWQAKKEAGTLKRPRFGAIFEGAFRRTTIVTTILFACGYGAAFGALQLAPQIVPALIPAKVAALKAEQSGFAADSSEFKSHKEQIDAYASPQQIVGNVQLYQEVGGLVGRFVLAWLALRIVSRRNLLRVFQVPGLIVIPAVFLIPGAGHLSGGSLDAFKYGIFFAGFFTVAQFSFWGNYLPRMYPTHLRGTGESFSANVGGRMLGTTFNLLATQLAFVIMVQSYGKETGFTEVEKGTGLAYASGAVVFLVYAVGVIASFWLPEPTAENLPE